MANAANKTQLTDNDVQAFLESIPDEVQRQDSKTLCRLLAEATGRQPQMWGSNIVGFGQYHYKYESGREGDFLAVGFSPRKANLTLYVMDDIQNHRELLDKLGPHKTGKGCLYVKRLSDVDLGVLETIARRGYQAIMANYPASDKKT